MNKLNLVGELYGRLTVLEEAEPYISPGGKKLRKWRCKCSCGSITDVAHHKLRSGHTQSCGCYARETFIKRFTKHGCNSFGIKTKEYSTWRGIKNRCLNANDLVYKHYGGRGIKVCDRWLESFENFLEDMEQAPSPEHTIERIDVNGDYCPENCKWLERKYQQRNTRQTKLNEDLVRYIRDQYSKGVRQVDLARELGISKYAIFRVVHNKNWKDVI